MRPDMNIFYLIIDCDVNTLYTGCSLMIIFLIFMVIRYSYALIQGKYEVSIT